MISLSSPEPLCDVAAQVRALLDPAHPKDAVWLARGTVVPGGIDAERVDLPEGVLFTTNQAKARYLRMFPTDEALALVLGYLEPKSTVVCPAVVVRAADEEGSIITEMACNAARIDAATAMLMSHGRVSITDVHSSLARRAELCLGGRG
jgi:hypothetical protein